MESNFSISFLFFFSLQHIPAENGPEPAAVPVSDEQASSATSLPSVPSASVTPLYREPHRRFLSKRPEVQRRNLKLIGQEKGDVILYCYDGYVDDVSLLTFSV